MMKPIISAKEDENQTHTLKYGDKKQVQSALMYIKKRRSRWSTHQPVPMRKNKKFQIHQQGKFQILGLSNSKTIKKR
jgi:hypothetical protein